MDDGGGDQEGVRPVPSADVSLETIPLHSTNLLTVLDREGTIVYESPAIERVYGFDQQALVGEQVAEYFHPEDRASVVEAFEIVVTSDERTVESAEYRHEQADGTYRWVESATSTDTTDAGHYVVNTREISERKARERELRRTNERLEEFAGLLSHDLRNPLTVARGNVELARQGDDVSHLEAVERAHDRMEALIEDLLTLARGGGVDETAPVDLAALVEDTWAVVDTADATLSVTCERRVQADRSRLQQLLANLLANAVEHGSTSPGSPQARQDAVEHGSTSPPSTRSREDAVEHGSTSPRSPSAREDAIERGSEAVTVTVGECADRDGFYVADDGPGIDDELRERVFQSDYSTADDGVGLGLTIVEDVADAHDWTVACTEGERGGARFEVTGVEFA